MLSCSVDYHPVHRCLVTVRYSRNNAAHTICGPDLYPLNSNHRSAYYIKYMSSKMHSVLYDGDLSLAEVVMSRSGTPPEIS